MDFLTAEANFGSFQCARISVDGVGARAKSFAAFYIYIWIKWCLNLKLPERCLTCCIVVDASNNRPWIGIFASIVVMSGLGANKVRLTDGVMRLCRWCRLASLRCGSVSHATMGTRLDFDFAHKSTTYIHTCVQSCCVVFALGDVGHTLVSGQRSPING